MKVTELLALWSARDSLYRMRKKTGQPVSLTDDEITSIRAYRRSETTDLAGDDQALARMTLANWIPPTPSR